MAFSHFPLSQIMLHSCIYNLVYFCEFICRLNPLAVVQMVYAFTIMINIAKMPNKILHLVICSLTVNENLRFLIHSTTLLSKFVDFF